MFFYWNTRREIKPLRYATQPAVSNQALLCNLHNIVEFSITRNSWTLSYPPQVPIIPTKLASLLTSTTIVWSCLILSFLGIWRRENPRLQQDYKIPVFMSPQNGIASRDSPSVSFHVFWVSQWRTEVVRQSCSKHEQAMLMALPAQIPRNGPDPIHQEHWVRRMFVYCACSWLAGLRWVMRCQEGNGSSAFGLFCSNLPYIFPHAGQNVLLI